MIGKISVGKWTISTKNSVITGNPTPSSKTKSLNTTGSFFLFLFTFCESLEFLIVFLVIKSWPLEEAISGSYDSSSPDGAASSPASKNIVLERNRRQKLNQRLFALRAVVPNITKVRNSKLFVF